MLYFENSGMKKKKKKNNIGRKLGFKAKTALHGDKKKLLLLFYQTYIQNDHFITMSHIIKKNIFKKI